MYEVNISEVVGNMSRPDKTWPTTNCVYGWTYNYSIYYPTITSQLNWVCEEDWKPVFAQSLFFLGSFLGTPVLGWMSDKWGRLPIIIGSNIMGGVAGVASAFATSLPVFTTLRFLVGLTYDTHYLVVFILLLEYVSKEYRTIASNVPIMIFLTLGLCTMPTLAVYLADWSLFAIVVHAPQFFSICFIWMLPESARWLLSKGRVEDTVKIIKRVAEVNKKSLTPEVIKEFEEFGYHQANSEKSEASALDLVKTPVMRLRFLVLCIMWMVIMLAYDGHVRNTQHIGSNVFVSFTIVGIVELPADFLTMILIEKVGRRHTTVNTLILSGVACFLIAALPETYIVSIMSVAVVGRFMITISINVAQQWNLEVLPTVARASGSSIIHCFGNIASFISPYIVYLSKMGHYTPYTIIGVVSILGGAICILLPETLNQILPDTLHDGETFCIDQGYCYNPCAGSGKDEREPDIALQCDINPAIADLESCDATTEDSVLTPE